MELMVCILIIGVLGSIALPIYRKSVEKARATEALNMLSTIARAEHSWAVSKNEYTSDLENLDINLDNNARIEEGILKTNNFEIVVSEGLQELKDTAYVTAFRMDSNSGNLLYTIFQCVDNNIISCVDNDTSDRITCESLGLLSSTDPMNPCGGYPINNKEGCKNTGGFWSSATGTCYGSAEDRCLSLSGTIEEGICKFTDNAFDIQNQIFEEGMACYGMGTGYSDHQTYGSSEYTYYGSCGYSTVTDGAICYGYGNSACAHSVLSDGGVCQVMGVYGCSGVIINDGGVCQGNGTFETRGCYRTEINSGGVCIGDSRQTCYRSTINDGGICRATSTVQEGYGCKEVTINSGGICVGIGNHGCRQAVVGDGGIVVAVNPTTGYMNTYQGSGCCVDCTGSGYCHNSGHVCSVTNEEKERYCSM